VYGNSCDGDTSSTCTGHFLVYDSSSETTTYSGTVHSDTSDYTVSFYVDTLSDSGSSSYWETTSYYSSSFFDYENTNTPEYVINGVSSYYSSSNGISTYSS